VTPYLEALFNGLSFSSILILTALGLAITFGVMRVINMAHGELLMLGAYVAHVVENSAYLGLNFFWAIPASFLVVALVGFLLEISLIRFLYNRPLDTLLATWGVGLVFQQAVRLLFGPDLKQLELPDILNGGFEWEGVGMTFPKYRLFIMAVTVVCVVGLYLLWSRTTFGLKVRAVTQNRPMAASLGISTRRVDSLAFALGAGLAGVAGCIVAHLYNVKSDMGVKYVVDAFMVVILGGVGELWGTVSGGAIIGSGNGVIAKFLGNEPMAKVCVLLLVIAFIQFRPSGIFAPKERSYE
jgi:urea transport system permease protein